MTYDRHLGHIHKPGSMLRGQNNNNDVKESSDGAKDRSFLECEYVRLTPPSMQLEANMAGQRSEAQRH